MNVAILLAAGESRRFGGDKLFCIFNNKPVICHSLEFLQKSPRIGAIFVAANRSNKNKIESLVSNYGFSKVKKIYLGGKSRYESSAKILPEIFEDFNPDYLIIHNAANPLAGEAELERSLRACKGNISGAAPGRKIFSTVKKARNLDSKTRIEIINTPLREDLWETQTPQVVAARHFSEAVRKNGKKNAFTDDLSVLEAAGKKTCIVRAAPENIKLTTKRDLKILKLFAGDVPDGFRVGIGSDSHKFGRSGDKNLILGGVKIKGFPKLLADSDGDVLLHALCNAISSAISGGSFGNFATAMCKNGIKDSKRYLQAVLKKMRGNRFRLVNCSFSFEASIPKIDPLSKNIKKKLACLLKIPQERIGITATSGEGLTPFGRGEAVKCQAAVLLASLL